MIAYSPSQPAQSHVTLAHLAQALHCADDPERAERMLRTVLHTLRASLSLERAVRLLQLLPSPFREMYIENWQAAESIAPFVSKRQFLAAVRKAAGRLAFYDFPTEAEVEMTVHVVFNYIVKQLSENQRMLLFSIRPFALRDFGKPPYQEFVAAV